MAHPRAGQPARPEDLIDVDAVLSAYYDLAPIRATRISRSSSEPPGTAAPVWTPPSTRTTSPRPRRRSWSTAPVRASPGRSTSARTPTPCRCLPGRPRSRCWSPTGSVCSPRPKQDYTPTPAVSRAIVVHNAGGPSTGSGHDSTGSGPVGRLRARVGRRHRGDPVAQPAPRRRLQVQPAARWPGGHRRDLLDRGPGQQLLADMSEVSADPVRARVRRGHPVRLSSAGTARTWSTRSTCTPSATPACTSAPTRSAAPASSTGPTSPSTWAST